MVSRRYSPTMLLTKRWSCQFAATVATAEATAPRTSLVRASRKQLFRASSSKDSSATRTQTTDEQKQVKSERRVKCKLGQKHVTLIRGRSTLAACECVTPPRAVREKGLCQIVKEHWKGSEGSNKFRPLTQCTLTTRHFCN